MKKIVCRLLCFIAISWSCTRDTEELAVQHDAPLTVPMAKEWFETRGFPWQNSRASSLRSESAYPDLTPLFDWDLAELHEDSAWTVVELPWEYENGHVSIATPEVKDYVESHAWTGLPQLTRLVVMKSKTTGDTYGFKMVVIPGLDYLLGAGGDLETNKYLSRDGDLSGLVMFYSLAGEFVNGWQYAGGQIIAKIVDPDTGFSPPAGMAKSPKLRSSWEYVTVETCYYIIVSADGGKTWSAPRLQECRTSTYAVLVANPNDRGPGGVEYSYEISGGGNAGGSPPGTPSHAEIRTLFKGICSLNSTDINKLNEEYEKMKAECFYGYIDSYLRTNNVQLNNILMAESGWAGQAGITNAGDLKFSDSSQITADNLGHEWIHLFQKQYHNMTTFGDKRGMMEFEVALARDILKFIETKGN